MLLDMIKAKKSLGQNFLNSQKIAGEIVAAGEVGPDDIVLEVGPGKGILTEELLKKAKKVIAVEKDEQLVKFLQTKFSDSIKMSRLEIICGDILQFQGLPLEYKIIANIPYYITSFFLRKFLSTVRQPNLIVLMVQKEVAERMMGGEKESLLSISVKAYGKPEIIRTVSRDNFTPAPKVDSAVIKISGISKEFFKDINEEEFFKLLKQGFAHKRKLLINNLAFKKENFTACSIEEKARAEDVSLGQWKCLAKLEK